MSPRPPALPLALGLAVLVQSACFVQPVDIAGKACDLQNSCDVGYACLEVDAGAGICLAEDGGG